MYWVIGKNVNENFKALSGNFNKTIFHESTYEIERQEYKQFLKILWPIFENLHISGGEINSKLFEYHSFEMKRLNHSQEGLNLLLLVPAQIKITLIKDLDSRKCRPS